MRAHPITIALSRNDWFIITTILREESFGHHRVKRIIAKIKSQLPPFDPD